MGKVKIKDVEYDLSTDYEALVLVLQELTIQIKVLADRRVF